MILSTTSLSILFLARFLQGVVVGIIFTVIPTYLVEISEPHRRAKIVSTTQIFWHFGILWAYVSGPSFNYYGYLLMCTLMAIIYVPVFYTLPESPYYLIMTNKTKEAYESLLFLRGDEVIEEEFRSLIFTVRQEMSNNTDWTYLFTEKEVRRALIIVQVVCLIRYLSGVPAIMIYVPELFNLSDSNIRPDLMTIIFGIILLMASIVGTLTADSAGRRPLLIQSVTGCTFFNAIIFIYLYMDISTKYHVSKHIWILYISVIGLCFVTIVGLGSLMLTIQAEYFQANTRSLSGGIIEMVAGFGAFINIIAYEYISEYLRVYWNFFFYTLVSLFGIIFFYYNIPETAGTHLGKFDNSANITSEKSESHKSKSQYMPFESEESND
ncbi:hypothetical protein O3M35_001861 [Rhynocoris fuscipes]|uniref:Major facilitator superfamily (MFS) profile domain-containing protein n=1 Tax=Rhynocoris fuscipes TaxID=488301 RepID=A0AAW1CUV8_9HEMI